MSATSAAKIHFSHIRTIGDRTITGTLCNRMVCEGDINCTTELGAVTCKLCLRYAVHFGLIRKAA